MTRDPLFNQIAVFPHDPKMKVVHVILPAFECVYSCNECGVFYLLLGWIHILVVDLSFVSFVISNIVTLI